MNWRSESVYVALLAGVVLLVFAGALSSPQALLTGDGRMSSVKNEKTDLLPSLGPGWDNTWFFGRAGATGWALPRNHFIRLVTSAPTYVKCLFAVDTFLLALAMYVWMRLKGLSGFAAWCGAVALALAGHSITLIRAGHLGNFAMFPYVIFAVACLDRGLDSGRLVLFAVAGVCFSQALAAQPDIAIMLGCLVAAFTLFRWIRGALERRGGAWHVRSSAGLALALGVFLASAWASIVGQYGAQVRDVAQPASGPAGGTEEGRKEKWEWATQWSLPPEDTIEVVAPCIWGINSGHPDGPYWGRQGRSPGWETTHQGFRNFREEGQYMGAIVFAFAALGLVGIWGHRKDQGEAWRARRPEVAFWAGAALVSLLLAWGKYAPLYRLFYALPKMSSIRNPVKFLYPFEVAMAVLFAFGVEWFLGMMSAPVAEPAVASGGSTPARGADRPARTAGKRR